MDREDNNRPPGTYLDDLDDDQIAEYSVDGEHGNLPRDLLFPRGLITTIANFIYQTATARNETLAVLASTALVSHLAARQIMTETGLGTAAYFFALAPSGAGKERPMAFIGDILTQIGAGDQVIRGSATGQGLEDVLLR